MTPEEKLQKSKKRIEALLAVQEVLIKEQNEENEKLSKENFKLACYVVVSVFCLICTITYLLITR